VIKTKVLKRALSLRKSGLSDEVCVKIILDLCADARDPQQASACATICAFFDARRSCLEQMYKDLEMEYLNHLQTCAKYNKEKSVSAPAIPPLLRPSSYED